MTTPIIQIEDFSAVFDKRVVLEEINLIIPPRQITVILGKSGCGKTTLLKHIIGLYPIRHGRIVVMDEDIGHLTEEAEKELALKMGVLFQNGALLNSLTVAENVGIPLTQHTRLPHRMIQDLICLKLELVGLGNSLHLFPTQLSGGMRKRAALARAIALDPPLLFCDEPSAGLDPVTMASLDQLILSLKEQLGMTIVLVTHEIPSIRRLADRVVFLDEGRLLFQGSLAAAIQSGIPEIRDFFGAEISKTPEE